MNARSPSETKGASLRTRIREATAAAILDAAEEVFADAGLHGAHMNDIAARAGVAVGTLYNHFKDRDALLCGLIELRRDQLITLLDEQIKDPGPGDFRAQLVRMLDRWFAFMFEHRRFYSILWQGELGSHTGSYPQAGKLAPDVMHDVYTRLAKVMKRGVKEKALRPDLAELYPALLMGLIRGVGIHAKLCGSDDEQKRKLLDPEKLIDFFLRGAGA